MKIIKSIKQMQRLAVSLKKSKSIALVPTMGYLHEGHLYLVRKAKSLAKIVIVSIYVNPLQFGKNEDLSRYPSDLTGDLKKLKSVGADFLFSPTHKDMYPSGFQTNIHIGELSKTLCGAYRPGHFDGVATVVSKLLQITQPDMAIFGKKDFQQYLIIKQLVRDLNFPVKIIGAAIVREKSNLALSSRNSYLSESQRMHATSISKALHSMKKACQSGMRDIEELRRIFIKTIELLRDVKVQYIEIVDRQTLQPLLQVQKGRTLIAAAVFVGKTRLIDNIEI